MKLLRYPGGSYADIYHWADPHRARRLRRPQHRLRHLHERCAAHRRPADRHRQLRHRHRRGGRGLGRYANVTKGYGVKYWEIGNENYGNGHYGADWEADDHADKSPAEYATNVVQYADAMKAVDPTIKIGAVLTTPANWPDGIVAAGDAGTWNDIVLSIAGLEDRLRDPALVPRRPSTSRSPSRPDPDPTHPPADRQVRRARLRAHRHRDDRVQHGVEQHGTHPARRAVRRRRLRGAAGAGACSRSTGGTSTTASAPSAGRGPHRLRRLRPAVQRRRAPPTARLRTPAEHALRALLRAHRW